jgi:hypothetical protein
MEAATRIAPRRLAALIAFTVAAYAVEVVTVHGLGARMPARGLAAAVLFDLAVVVPLVWWWVALRRVERGARRALTLVVASIAGAMLVVPSEGRALVHGARVLVLPAEIAVLAVGVRAAVRAWRAKGAGDDLAEAVERALVSALGANAVARMAAAEVSTVAYAILGGRRRAVAPAEVNRGPGARVAFSLGSARMPAITWGLVLATIVEGVVVHLVVGHAHPAAAWVMTGLGVYAVLWLVGHDRALAARTLEVTPEHLVLRAGLRLSARVPWSSIEGTGSRTGAAALHVDATRPAEANVVVRFRSPVEVTAALGLRRRVASVAMCVDDPDGLVAAIRDIVGA